MPVYNSAYPWKEHPPEGGKPWAFEDKAWRLDGTRLVVDAPKGDLVWARYGGRINSDSGVIRDTYAYDYDLAVPSRQATNGEIGRAHV